MMLLRLVSILLLAIALPAGATDFHDRDALVTQLDLGTQASLADAEENLAAAQADLADAQAHGGDVASAQAKVDAAQADVAKAQTQLNGAGPIVAQLSDRQVFALSRALNDSRHNGLAPLPLDLALVQRIADEDLSNGQIQQLTHAVELRARFDQHAARFDAKADATGDARFHDRADRARERGAALEDKFLARIDGSSAAAHGARNTAAEKAHEAADEAAREAAREHGKHAAKEAAREAAQDQAHQHGK